MTSAVQSPLATFPEPLPFRRRWYPMGYPIDVVTNSAEVLAGAASIWQAYPSLSEEAPVELKIEVSESGAAPVPAAPCHLEHLVTIVQGPDNFAIADMVSGVGLMRISREVAKNSGWFLYHFLEPIAYVLLGARHFAMVHASCIALQGAAVLLCGPAGAGKTCLAYASAKRGWSFISGDATQLPRGERDLTVVGRPFSIRFRYSAKVLFPELSAFRASLRPNGKCDLELDPRQLGLSLCLRARAGLVVFLNRVPGISRPEIQPASRRYAQDTLRESIRVGDARTRAEQAATLDRLIDKPCVLLTYSDPAEAEKLLRSMVTKAN